MNKISELKAILGDTFIYNKARLDCFTHALVGLFLARTVNLSEIAIAFPSKANVSSRYKRLQRFFRQFEFDYIFIAQWIFALFSLENQKLYIAIDRTNWYWGKQHINILTLAVIYNGVAIPLFWKLLPTRGSTSFKDQQELIQLFCNTFGKNHIAGILADREFANGQLFRWLTQENITFFIRIKENALVENPGNKTWHIGRFFNYLNPKTSGSYFNAITLYGAKIWVAGGRSEKGELMIIATNQPPKDVIKTYLIRWKIETFFCCLKSRGFRFEDTHMTKDERIQKLMVLLAIGFCWALKVGEWIVLKKPITIKKHRDGHRPQHSLFRHGLNLIREMILNPFKTIEEFKLYLSLLEIPLIKQEMLL